MDLDSIKFTEQESQTLLWAKGFVGALDRSILGRFAVDKSILILCNVIHFHDIHTGSRGATVSQTVLQNFALMSRGVTSLTDAQAEMFLWWSRSGDDVLMERAAGVSAVQLIEKMHKLSIVADCSPAALKYYEAGIWEKTFINRCIRENIDLDMAVRLSEAA